MKYLATLAAVIAVLVITVAGAADTDTGSSPPNAATYATFTVNRDQVGLWHAQVIVAQAPPPPPGPTANLYRRVIERDGQSRAEAIRRLVVYLGATIAAYDLEFEE